MSKVLTTGIIVAFSLNESTPGITFKSDQIRLIIFLPITADFIFY